MDPNQIKVPPMKDLNIDNITENTVTINSQSSDQRLTYVMERLVTHLHDFARETRLSTNEWMAALNFLVRVGQISTEVRHVCLPPNTLCISCLPPSITQMFSNEIATGIHPSLRYPRSLPPRRRNRSPQTPRLNGRLGPRPLPHSRSRTHRSRLFNVLRPRRRALYRPLHSQRRIWKPYT